MAADKKFAALSSAEGNSTKHHEYLLFRLTKFFLKPVVVVIAESDREGARGKDSGRDVQNILYN